MHSKIIKESPRHWQVWLNGHYAYWFPTRKQAREYVKKRKAIELEEVKELLDDTKMS